jgi:PAS domain-containing protein
MNVDLEQPRLLITQKTASDLHGECSACGRSLHAFVRTTEKDALWLLTRSFKLHCRRIHSLVVHPALPVDEMVESLPLPAYVCAKGTRKVVAANQRFRQVMGYTADEIGELRLDDFRAPEDVPFLLESLQRAGGAMVDQRYRTKEGRFLQVRLRYQDINLFQNETAVRDARFVVLTSIEAV